MPCVVSEGAESSDREVRKPSHPVVAEEALYSASPSPSSSLSLPLLPRLCVVTLAASRGPHSEEIHTLRQS